MGTHRFQTSGFWSVGAFDPRRSSFRRIQGKIIASMRFRRLKRQGESAEELTYSANYDSTYFDFLLINLFYFCIFIWCDVQICEGGANLYCRPCRAMDGESFCPCCPLLDPPVFTWCLLRSLNEPGCSVTASYKCSLLNVSRLSHPIPRLSPVSGYSTESQLNGVMTRIARDQSIHHLRPFQTTFLEVSSIRIGH